MEQKQEEETEVPVTKPLKVPRYAARWQIDKLKMPNANQRVAAEN